MNIKKLAITFCVVVIIMLVAGVTTIFSDSLPTITFETYSFGNVHGQDGWTSAGAAGVGCAMYDHAVDTSYGRPGFGARSLRISNAVTSGCFGDQTFSKPLTDSVGEVDATAGTFPEGTRQNHFETEFQIASAADPPAYQPGLFVSVSPDRGDGSRMSYVGFEDVADGLNIIFYDVQGTSNPANFVLTDLGTYDRNAVHTIKLVMDVFDGPSNDVVEVYIDGTLAHTGTSWENYYRYDSEASAEQSPRIVRTVLFRTGGTAVPETLGKGFLFDNLTLMSSTRPPEEPDPFAVPAECSDISGLGAPIIGTDGNNNIFGTNGNDLIFALGGRDVVIGKDGDDCIVGGGGPDWLFGNNGNDVILGQGGWDILIGGHGDDTLIGGDGHDSAFGIKGTDTCDAEFEISCEL